MTIVTEVPMPRFTPGTVTILAEREIIHSRLQTKCRNCRSASIRLPIADPHLDRPPPTHPPTIPRQSPNPSSSFTSFRSCSFLSRSFCSLPHSMMTPGSLPQSIHSPLKTVNRFFFRVVAHTAHSLHTSKLVHRIHHSEEGWETFDGGVLVDADRLAPIQLPIHAST